MDRARRVGQPGDLLHAGAIDSFMDLIETAAEQQVNGIADLHLVLEVGADPVFLGEVQRTGVRVPEQRPVDLRGGRLQQVSCETRVVPENQPGGGAG